MAYKRLFIFVEGPDDLRFFEKVAVPIFYGKYDLVECISYSNMKNKKIKDWMRSIKAMKADYIFVTDINDSPCVIEKKSIIINQLKNSVAQEQIIVTIKEIESWYLAGITDKEGLQELAQVSP